MVCSELNGNRTKAAGRPWGCDDDESYESQQKLFMTARNNGYSAFLHLSIYLSMYLSIYLPIYLSAYPSIYPSIYPSTLLLIFLTIYLSIQLYTSISLYLSIYQSLYMSIYSSNLRIDYVWRQFEMTITRIWIPRINLFLSPRTCICVCVGHCSSASEED
jgi:hypothetical protein